MPIPGLLRELLLAVGPSGHEERAARVWREAASAFAEVESDSLGTSYARVRCGEGAPVLALVGHIDEIGVAITHIDERGLLSFNTLGGINPEILAGQRVRLLGREGDVCGVIGRRQLSSTERRGDRSRVELTDLHIDIGAKDRGDAETYVRVGDAGVWEGEPVELPNHRFTSRALDNRLGAYVALEAARRIGEAGDAQVDVVAVAVVQEELGYAGSTTAAFMLEPTVAIAIDVTYSTDVPGADAKVAGTVELGTGVAITRGPVVNRHVADLLVRAAEEEGIPHGFEVYTGRTQTDADALHVARAGVPTGLVALPLRYMHSPGEIASLDDVEATIALVVAFARRLTRESSFLR
jgi:putative aminopeptidase FrvX